MNEEENYKQEYSEEDLKDRAFFLRILETTLKPEVLPEIMKEVSILDDRESHRKGRKSLTDIHMLMHYLPTFLYDHFISNFKAKDKEELKELTREEFLHMLTARKIKVSEGFYDLTIDEIVEKYGDLLLT